MTTTLTVTTGRTGDGPLVLTATGEIDMSNAESFAAALADAREAAGPSPMTIDLTGVEYLDSAGLAALFPHADHVRLVATPLLAPVLTVAGLDDILTTVPGT